MLLATLRTYLKPYARNIALVILFQLLATAAALYLPTLNARIIDTEFKDLKNGQYKIISFYAKKARGLMVRYVIKERIRDPEQLKAFDYQGYRYSAEQSKPDSLVFLRDHSED